MILMICATGADRLGRLVLLVLGFVWRRLGFLQNCEFWKVG